MLILINKLLTETIKPLEIVYILFPQMRHFVGAGIYDLAILQNSGKGHKKRCMTAIFQISLSYII